uniref:Uncharacterized protein n=1 Tax=Kangiella spongicola TaxID=796379 RepID=A0A318D323_9GAMM
MKSGNQKYSVQNPLTQDKKKTSHRKLDKEHQTQEGNLQLYSNGGQWWVLQKWWAVLSCSGTDP